MGDRPVEIVLSIDSSGQWRLNGTQQPQVSGCIDLDLNFSPSTNLLPIRRLGLAAASGSELHPRRCAHRGGRAPRPRELRVRVARVAHRQGEHRDARIATVRKEGMKNVAAAAIERWFTLAFRQKNPSTIAGIRKVLEQTSPEGYAANCAAVRDFDFRDRLGGIRTPTLVIAGTHDPATTPADGHFLADHIPGARYVELNAAHLSNIEDAGRFNREVSSFLNS